MSVRINYEEALAIVRRAVGEVTNVAPDEIPEDSLIPCDRAVDIATKIIMESGKSLLIDDLNAITVGGLAKLVAK